MKGVTALYCILSTSSVFPTHWICSFQTKLKLNKKQLKLQWQIQDHVKETKKRASNGFNNAGKTQNLVWSAERHGWTATKRNSRTKFWKSAPVYYSLRQGTNGKKQKEVNQLWVENVATDQWWKMDMIGTIKIENLTLLVRELTGHRGSYPTTIWSFLRQELQLFPYNLQMHQKIAYGCKLDMVHFKQCCRNLLRNNPDFLNRLCVSMSVGFYSPDL